MEKAYTGTLAFIGTLGTVGAWLLEHGLSTACGIAGLAASVELWRYTRLKRKMLLEEKRQKEADKP